MAVTVAGVTHVGPTPSSGGGGTTGGGGGSTGGTSLIDSATTTGVQPVGQTGWTLAMSEEFGGAMTVTDSTLGYVKFRTDGPNWATWYPNWPRFNSQTPGGNHTNTNQAAYYATSKVSLDGAGALRLACDKQTTVSGLTYTAGMIQSLPSFTTLYGYYEARIKVDIGGVPGHWPAWWMSASAFDTWPPEIDIWEYFGNGTDYLNNVYDAGETPSINHVATTSDTYHVYGAKWTSTSVTFYRDGTPTTTVTGSVVPTLSQYLLLNNGADGQNGSLAFGSNAISVDYVRAWQ